MAQNCEIEWWILNTCLIPIVTLHLRVLDVKADSLKNPYLDFILYGIFWKKTVMMSYHVSN